MGKKPEPTKQNNKTGQTKRSNTTKKNTDDAGKIKKNEAEEPTENYVDAANKAMTDAQEVWADTAGASEMAQDAMAAAKEAEEAADAGKKQEAVDAAIEAQKAVAAVKTKIDEAKESAKNYYSATQEMSRDENRNLTDVIGSRQPENTNGNIDCEPLIDTLLTEHKNVQERVFKQIEQYEQTNVKILMLVGVLLLFGISNFKPPEPDPFLDVFVDLTFVVALPLISIGAVLLSLADLVKVMILGDYLLVIETKVNMALESFFPNIITSKPQKYDELKPFKAMEWERWRIHHGHVKSGLTGSLSEISFSVIIVVLIVLVSAFSAIARVVYIEKNCKGFAKGVFWDRSCMKWVLIGLGVLFLAVFVISIVAVYMRRRETKLHVIADRDTVLRNYIIPRNKYDELKNRWDERVVKRKEYEKTYKKRFY